MGQSVTNFMRATALLFIHRVHILYISYTRLTQRVTCILPQSTHNIYLHE